MLVLIVRTRELARGIKGGVITAIDLITLSEHLELRLVVQSLNLRLMLRVLATHRQLSHVSLVHIAELGNEVTAFAATHNRRCILHVMTEFEQRVRRFASKVVRVSTLALAALAERIVDQWTQLGLPRAE